jgi:hypothetical protein
MADETVNARQAALLLHGLEPATRKAVLARLGPAETAAVMPLLDELVELGVPMALGERLHANIAVSATNAEAAKSKLTAKERVARMRPDELAWCLQQCAVITVAVLIHATEWPWRDAALDRMPESRRCALATVVRGKVPRLTAAALEALCECLCARVILMPAREPPRNGVELALLRFKNALRRMIQWTR